MTEPLYGWKTAAALIGVVLLVALLFRVGIIR